MEKCVSDIPGSMPSPEANKPEAKAGLEEKEVSLLQALREQQSTHEQRVDVQLKEHEQRIEALVLQLFEMMEGRTFNSGFQMLPALSQNASPGRETVAPAASGRETLAPKVGGKATTVQVRAAATVTAGKRDGSASQEFTEMASTFAWNGTISDQARKSKLSKTTDLSGNVVSRFAQSILDRNRFDYLVATLIVTNACCIGAHTDWSIRNLNETPPSEYRVLDLFFLSFFTCELVLRLFAEGWFFVHRYNKNLTWNVLDSLVVLSAIAEEVFLLLSSELPTMQAVRLLRVLRLVRIVRVLRVMRFFHDLRQMVYGILSTLKSLIWCLLLLILVQFMFAVCIMQIITMEFEDMTQDDDYQAVVLGHFGSMIQALYTLDKSIFGGLDWGDAADPLQQISPFLNAFFVLYISFAMLCVLNVVTGVFVENANKITMMDEDAMIMAEVATRNTWLSEVKRLFDRTDVDGSGSVNWEEFSQVCGDLQAQSLMRKLGIAVHASATKGLFDLLDFDGDGTVDLEEFVLGIQQIHGHARSIDMVKLKYQNKNLLKKVEDLRAMVESVFTGRPAAPRHTQKIRAQQTLASPAQLRTQQSIWQTTPVSSMTVSGAGAADASTAGVEMQERNSGGSAPVQSTSSSDSKCARFAPTDDDFKE